MQKINVTVIQTFTF